VEGEFSEIVFVVGKENYEFSNRETGEMIRVCRIHAVPVVLTTEDGKDGYMPVAISMKHLPESVYQSVQTYMKKYVLHFGFERRGKKAVPVLRSLELAKE